MLQALIILSLAAAVSLTLVPVLRIPLQHQEAFRVLVFGQGTVLAIQFAFRPFVNLLVAHQRNDLGNCLNSVALIIGFGVLWLSFALGAGIMSLLWSQFAGAIVSVLLGGLCCRNLRLMPKTGTWRWPTWGHFMEVFGLGQRVFLLVVAGQIINASPTIIVARTLGLEAAAVWSVCTRPFLLLFQVITRIFDYSTPALAEMMVHGDHDRMLSRSRSLIGLSVSLSVAAAAVFVISNQPFVHIWTHGTLGWAVWNDALLGIWLIVQCSVHVHTGLAIQTKKLELLPQVLLLQAVVFIGGTLMLAFQSKFGGITSMLALAVVATLVFGFPYSMRRTAQYFQTPLKIVGWAWNAPAIQLMILLSPPAAALWWLTEPLNEIPKLVLRIVLLGTFASIMFFRVGLDRSVREDLFLRAPAYMKRPLRVLIGYQQHGNIL
ncbi:MAG: oligosaccharide flippase family protein [Verrucomicrobia subdivision 3 bacterium]|nr:oligosaccharide flippase family protein [Limisphaerales bacterium]